MNFDAAKMGAPRRLQIQKMALSNTNRHPSRRNGEQAPYDYKNGKIFAQLQKSDPPTTGKPRYVDVSPM